MDANQKVDVVVLGSGPGGYTAAFRAADLGKKVVLVEREESLGGVCLNVGCIPSKALLHAAKVLSEAAEFKEHGIRFGEPTIDLNALRTWKESIINRLTSGLKGLAKQRKVTVIRGEGHFFLPIRLWLKPARGSKLSHLKMRLSLWVRVRFNYHFCRMILVLSIQQAHSP